MAGNDGSPTDRSVSSITSAGRWDALTLAIKAHEGQADKGGAAYIGHCLHVAGRAYEAALREGWSTGFAIRCYRVGLLHDVLEDCAWATLEMVEEAIGGIDAQAVVRLTKTPLQDRGEYISAISRNQLANIVKRCDLAHNMDLRRLSEIMRQDLIRREKYQRELLHLQKAARSASEDTQAEQSEGEQ